MENFDLFDNDFSAEAIKSEVEAETIEVDYSLDRKEIENSNLVRLEMNVIEFPFFTKNKKIKLNTKMKYVFSKNKNRWLCVIPQAGSKIPGEFEERIFYALMQLYRNNNYNDTVYFDYFTLIKEMGVSYSGSILRQVKKGLDILAGTNYEFNNCFYLNEMHGIKNENLKTGIFSIRTIEFKNDREVPEECKKYFKNKRIKELVAVTFKGDFYKNVVTKGFLRFDSKMLLEMDDSVARTIFLMITKWRNKELYIKRYSKEIAGKIPLSFEKGTMSHTIKRIKKALDYLKDRQLLSDYRFCKEGGLPESYFDIFFKREHNFDFYTDNSTFTGQELLLIEKMEATGNIAEAEIVKSSDDKIEIENIDLKVINELISLLPDEEKMKSGWESKFKEILLNHSPERVKADIAYTNINAKENYEAYLIKAISSGHWGWESTTKKRGRKKKVAEEQIKLINSEEESEKLKHEMIDKENRELDIFYNSLDDFDKGKIYMNALEIMKEENQNTAIEKLVKSLFNTTYKYKALKKYREELNK